MPEKDSSTKPNVGVQSFSPQMQKISR